MREIDIMAQIDDQKQADRAAACREVRKKSYLARSRFVRRLYSLVQSTLEPSRNKFHSEPLDLETAPPVLLETETKECFSRLRVGIVRDSDQNPYYTKFVRFLKNNQISFEFIDIHRSSWERELRDFGLSIWVPSVYPWDLEEAREKIWYAEQRLHKWIFPSLREVMFYENKAVQHATLKDVGAPVINTFISHDYDEALQWISTAKYPFVSKLKTGSSSNDVLLVRNSLQARTLVERVFRNGCPTSVPSHRQKNYVLFQDYVQNYGFDLRVVVIDRDHVFGYYREVPRGDFRASGFGDVVKKDLPQDALKIAVETAEKLDFTNITLDFLRSTADGRYYIIEGSNFISIESDMQLRVDGRPGRYRYDPSTGLFVFEEGRFWVQELMLRRLFERRAAAGFDSRWSMHDSQPGLP